MRVPVGTPRFAEGEDVLVIGPAAEMRFLSGVEKVPPSPTAVSGRSVFFAAGCFISFFLLLISLLDQNPTNTTVFAVLSLVFPLLWAMPIRRRRS
jgi:hypothetical protein